MVLHDRRKPETIIRALQREIRRLQDELRIANRESAARARERDVALARALKAEQDLAEWKDYFDAVITRFDVLVAREAAASGGDGGEEVPEDPAP